MSREETVTIPRRFNGPRESGNGGYTSGVIAGHLDGAVEVNLRSPVPLDEPLELSGDHETLRLHRGETLIAEGRPVHGLGVAVPAPVGPEEARRAAANYRAPIDGLFSNCFVCGRRAGGQLRRLRRAGRGTRARRHALDPARLDRRR